MIFSSLSSVYFMDFLLCFKSELDKKVYIFPICTEICLRGS